MARFIHLNGPPGIGKSTLSALWTQRHPGTLNLDIDTLHRLVGGWRDVEQDTHAILRPVALAMASTHLGANRDVVLPQYVARLDQIEAFEQVARDQGEAFDEVVLIDGRAASIDRFQRRADDREWDAHNRRIVERQGGADFLAGMYDQLIEVMQARPSAAVISSEPDAIEATYALLEQALGE